MSPEDFDFMSEDKDKDELMEAELAQLVLQPNPPPSNLSSPSGVPLSTIASLTHDELRQNAEFMKYVNMVTMLQELLKFRQGSTLSCKFFFFFSTLFLVMTCLPF